MKKNNIFKKILILILVVALAVPFISVPMTSFAATEEELKQQMEELQKKIDSEEEKLSGLKSDMAKQQEYIDAVNEQINGVNEQISIVQKQIDAYDAKIAACNKEITDIEANIEQINKDIEQKKAEIQTTYDQLKARLRSMYMYGNVSEFEIVLGAKDFETFLTSVELVSRVSKRDNELIADVKRQIDELAKMQEELDASKQEVEAKKAELEVSRGELQVSKDTLNSKKSEINSKRQELKGYMATLDTQSSAYQKQIERYQKEIEDIEDELDAKSLKVDVGKYTGGKLGIPTPTLSYISSPYGYRTDPITGKRGAFHGGMDISGGGALGARVNAAESGTVVLASGDGSWNGGYGNYIKIAHDNGLYTIYAHLSSVGVYQGQRVVKGQQIGKVGSTGNSTGPHLHFEVRTGPNSSDRKNPIDYVPSGYYHR